MKVVILAGGEGQRLQPLTADRHKAMVEIGGQPILEHLIGIFLRQGFCEFVVALGHKQQSIVDWQARVPMPGAQVTLVDTGTDCGTGGRLLRLRKLIGEAPFLLTWCDGLADIDLSALLAFHQRHGRLATVTAVHPPSRFGVLELAGEQVSRFSEKPVVQQQWVNGAFFVLQPEVLDHVADDATMLELQPMHDLVADGQLMAYRHEGFWACMDTVADQQALQRLWEAGAAPWTGSVVA